MNSPYEVIDITLMMAKKKYHTPTLKLILLGLMAGIFIAMGGLLSSLTAGGLAGLGTDNPFLPKLLAGATFPVGLMLVILVGAELFTGNTAYLMPATLNGYIPRWYFLKNWAIVYLANFVGALLFDYFLVYQTGVMSANDAYVHYIHHAAELKVNDLSWLQVFWRGVGANWMVCLAVWMGFASKGMLGRLVGIWWPVMAFVAIGYEHSVANMFYVPTAIFHGAHVTWSDFFLNNLIPSTLGNIVGGAGFVGCAYGYLYAKQPH
ncbi:MAG: formate/nitrite transporter family protein [Bacteroidales bacterium]|nr:formate/nitrite transporter family protein [Bacteroidales bacterium]